MQKKNEGATMAKQTSKHASSRIPLTRSFPFAMTTQMYFYLPICDYDPYAAFLLEQCYIATILSNYEYEQKHWQEQARLAAMSEEEREQESERIIGKMEDAYYDQMLNEYNGESWLNDEDDALEGKDGYFDLNLPYLVSKFPKEQEQDSEQKILDAYHLLAQKGFIRNAVWKEQLDLYAIDAALRVCYPAIFARGENVDEQKRKQEARKVQQQVYRAKRAGLPATLTSTEWFATLAYFEWKCAYCGIAPYTVIEHVQPIIEGGGTTQFNCVPACDDCNLLKGDIPPELLSSTFGAALEKIQHYLDDKKQRYLQQIREKRNKNP
jgi:5-methylcytosine-specific restriction endonuclease McrA